LRIVIDTNIWISGLLWRGKAWQLLKLAEQRKVELCIAYSMLLELEEVLSYEKFLPRLEVLQQTPEQLASYALSISSIFDVSRSGIPIISDDPDDDIFLLCAVEADATHIVSNDRHLLNLKSYQGIKIVTIDQFLNQDIDS